MFKALLLQSGLLCTVGSSILAAHYATYNSLCQVAAYDYKMSFLLLLTVL